MGVRGAPIATSLSRLVLSVVLGVMMVSKHGVPAAATVRKMWRTAANVSMLKKFLLVGLPHAALVAIPAWLFAASTILAGVFESISALGSHFLVLNCVLFSYALFPAPLAGAAASRVVALLSAGQGKGVRVTLWLSLGFGLTYAVLSTVLLVLLRPLLGNAFSSNFDVASDSSRIFIAGALCQAVYGVQGVFAAVLRAIGRSRAVGLASVAGLWTVGLPIGSSLAFATTPRLAMYGMWWGLAVGFFVVCTIFMFLVLQTDWENSAALIQSAVQEKEEEEDPNEFPMEVFVGAKCAKIRGVYADLRQSETLDPEDDGVEHHSDDENLAKRRAKYDERALKFVSS